MRISKLVFLNHKIFGNLVMDLSKKGDSGYKKIILLGENGSGKTTLLNDLYSFLSLRELNINEIEYSKDDGEKLKLVQNKHSFTLGFHTIIKGTDKIEIESSRTNEPSSIEANELDIRRHGVVYSRVQVDFKTQIITNIGSSDINIKEDDGRNYDFTKIKQLLIDISSQDSLNFSNMHSDGQNISYSEFEKNYSKVFKFKNAINSFFDNIKFKKIDTLAGKKDVVFEKNGVQISIDDLSTGEKQIVYRGVFILKNISLHGNGFVLIDEPEISMHPRWENRIFEFYSNLLFSGNHDIGQLIIATHSERILSKAIQDVDALVIGIKENNGSFIFNRYDAQLVLPYISDAEINLKIFNVYTNDLQLQLYDHIQTINGFRYITEVDNFISSHPLFTPALDQKVTSHNGTVYTSICTSVRNDLHHGRPYSVTEEDLKKSIDLMYQICGGTI